jgi:hypothetical protein
MEISDDMVLLGLTAQEVEEQRFEAAVYGSILQPNIASANVDATPKKLPSDDSDRKLLDLF